jgi:transcriptional regulator with XRE-family HTH domain
VIDLRLLDRAGRREVPERCEICDAATREGKRLCTEHVEGTTYAQQVIARQERREAEVRSLRAGRVDLKGLLVAEVIEFLSAFGEATVARVARDVGLDHEGAERIARVLKKAGAVDMGETRRGGFTVALRPLAKKETTMPTEKKAPRDVAMRGKPGPFHTWIAGLTPERIKRWRELHGIRQSDVGAALRVNSAACSYWETGRCVARPDVQTRLLALIEAGPLVDRDLAPGSHDPREEQPAPRAEESPMIPPVPLVQEVKCDPEPFQAILDRRKRCEVQADRAFVVGGLLELREHGSDGYTGRRLHVAITHAQAMAGGLVVLSIELRAVLA